MDLRLDSRPFAMLTHPPWKTTADFGPEPEPHELVAIGRDAAGAEVARARQMVNLPRQPAEAVLVLVPGSGGHGRTARLTWESALGLPPERVDVTLDGRPVAFQTPREIALPDFVPEQVHFLRADLDFPDNLVASAEVIFGGRDRDESRTELTGIPVVFAGKVLTADQLGGAFLADGRPAVVSAVEEGPGEIVVVRDEEAREPLRRMPPRLLFDITLRPGQKLRFCWPVTRPADEVSERYDVFMRSPDLSAASGGLQAFLSVPRAPALSSKPRFADAISVAALSAAGRNRARAVLYITGGSADASTLQPETVRRFLAKLRVPLYVWAIDGPSAHKAARWGSVRVLRDYPAFLAAAQRLLDDVASQRIVWVEGDHLPQSITVSPAARGIRIVE